VTDKRPLPSEQQVAAVYRQLADDYSLARASANRERTWQRIELKWSLQRKGALQPRSAIAPRARARLLGYAAAALAFAVVCVFLLWPHSAQLEYAVRGGPVSTGNMGHGWVVTAEQVATLDFTDGSELALAPDTALNVNALGPHGAFTRLARGSVHVAVEHHDDTRWTFLAGPYEVRVEGTKFDLSWQAERFELSMQEGRVRVVGPDQHEWVLERGESLVVPSSEPKPDVSARAPEPEPATSLPPQAASAPGDEANDDEANDDEAVATTSPAGHARDWARLLRNGRFSEIVGDARRAGIKRSIEGRPIGDVAALAQAARYTGDSGLAEDCWKAIRARAPGSSDAHQSAFFLGRVMEQQGRRADAIHWFQRYREESPGGVYAGQALGRQMVLTGGHGRSPAARGLAEDYLARFPNGPYAKAAKAVLGEGTAASGVDEAGDALSGE
jgi:ferric-dicitrate binding protein FerR (iron transport regulator)